MKKTRRARQVLETLLARFGMLVVPGMSRGGVIRLARMLGWVAYVVSRRDRTVGRANLELAFAETHAADERERILRESFVTFARLTLDLFWFSRNQEQRLAEYVEFEDSCRFFFDNPPCIALTAHFGNWEVMGIGSAALGSPLTVVFAELKNPAIDELIGGLRRSTGQSAVEKTGVLRRLIRTVRDGGHVGVLLDQNTLPFQGGCFVDLFGVPAPMSMAVASLTEKTDAPVVPAFCRGEANGRYVAYNLPPLRRDDAESKEEFTQRLARVLEGEIREYPEQWLWMYKRWKFIPDDISEHGFPDYARRLRPRERGRGGR